MTSLSAFSKLIGHVYDAILAPSQWHPALEKLCGTLEARASSIHVLNPIDGHIGLFVEHGTDPEWSAKLLSYGKMTPTGAAVLLAEVDEPVCLFDLIDQTEFRESRFYLEWCKPQGYFEMMGALVAKRPREIGAVSVIRQEGEAHFGPRERELMGLVAPHFRRAVTIAGLLEHREVSIGNLKTVVDQLASAVFVVDGGRRILQANLAAQTLLNSGGMLEEREGRLYSTHPETDDALRAALASGATGPVMVPMKFLDGALRIAAVLPIDRAAGIYTVFLHAPEPDIPALGRYLVQAFQFTPREVAVLMPLLEGNSISDAAESLGVSVATARSHLQRLFEKTKTDRQADLVRVIMQAMPPVRMG